MAKTVAVVLQERLYEYGVRHVFGIIGRESSAIAFDEVKGIEFILTRHEFTAAAMAGVLATLTGRPQACFATLGSGMTNLCTGVGTALLDRFPLIALSAQAETYDCVPGQSSCW